MKQFVIACAAALALTAAADNRARANGGFQLSGNFSWSFGLDLKTWCNPCCPPCWDHFGGGFGGFGGAHYAASPYYAPAYTPAAAPAKAPAAAPATNHQQVGYYFYQQAPSYWYGN
jgi:hypothetical protein